jgi:Amt family ammonium transporter
MGNAKNSIMGLFMMWWASLAFNSGSTFGVTINKWSFAARATVATMCSSFGGGLVGLAICYIFFGGKINVSYVCNCVFGSLAAITGSSYLVRMYEAVLIGMMSGIITFTSMMVLERTSLDDPCGAFAVHGLSGAWGLIALGIFGQKDTAIMEYNGLLHGGYINMLPS